MSGFLHPHGRITFWVPSGPEEPPCGKGADEKTIRMLSVLFQDAKSSDGRPAGLFFPDRGFPAEAASDPRLEPGCNCAKTEDDGERLKCYDNLVGRQIEGAAPAEESAERLRREAAQQLLLLFPALGTGAGDPSAKITPFPPTDPTTSFPTPTTTSPNSRPSAGRPRDKISSMTRSSFSAEPEGRTSGNDIFGQKADLWFGYTQRSFWQILQLRGLLSVPGDEL